MSNADSITVTINFTERKAAANAIDEIKQAGGRFDATTKTWTITAANIPAWYLTTPGRTNDVAELGPVAYVIHRATNFGRNNAVKVAA